MAMLEYVVRANTQNGPVIALAPSRDVANCIVLAMREDGLFGCVTAVPTGRYYRCSACGGAGCSTCGGIGYVSRLEAAGEEARAVERGLKKGVKYEKACK